jgi:glucan phosphoethanolaminetransferase (alkaline phosphatase superfamily)
MNNLIKKLSSENAILTSGFMIGFCHQFKFNKVTLEYPLTTTFQASIYGIFTSIGALFVADLLPGRMRIIIPIIATVSCAYYKYNDLY